MVKLSLILVFSMVITLSIAGYPSGGGGGGHSSSWRKQDDYGNYGFGYDITDPWGSKNYRQESGNKWAVSGSYGLHDVDGRMRVVDYVADGGGFRAKIRSNEPGVTNADSADAIYNGPDAHGYSGGGGHRGGGCPGGHC